MTREEAWKELKETIIEMRDNDGIGTQQEVCRFLVNLMHVLGKQVQEPCEDTIHMSDIDGIKAEIKAEISDYEGYADFHEGIRFGLRTALEIIDKYKAESEGQAAKPQETVTEFADRCKECGAKYGRLLKQKTGRWETEDMFDGDVAYRCSACNELFWIESGTPKDNGYNFCPKCGAKMEGGQNGN